MLTRIPWIPILGFGLATILGGSSPARVHAQEHGHDKESMSGHSHAMSELHGGSVTMTPSHHFEALFTQDGVRLYVYDGKQNPIMTPQEAKVRLTLLPREGEPVAMPMIYLAPDSAKGTAQGCFLAEHSFGKLEKGSMKAMFHVEGLGEKPVEFKTSVQLTEKATYACPMHPKMHAADPMRCPTCGMTMEKVGSGEEKGHGHDSGHGHH